MEEHQSKVNEKKAHKPAKNHPWKRGKGLTTEQQKWAHEQSKISGVNNFLKGGGWPQK